jgi:type II secretory pathway predicted ATPase ExeA
LRLLEDSKDIAYAYLFNSRLTPTEFLQYVVSDFGIPVSGKNKCDFLLDLSKFLVSRGSKHLTTVLIVDEAHDLPVETLEELRLLSNLETTDDKLIQIILMGQPELDAKLDSVELRQLKQRIPLRTQLGALTPKQTQEYIEQRLRIAGADPVSHPLFSPQALAAVHSYSRGFPRLINIICENALISAYAKQVPTVKEQIIEDLATELRIESPEALRQVVHVDRG